MRKGYVRAVLRLDEQELLAEFQPTTGRLIVSQGAAILEEIDPPDSWFALALINRGTFWGTRPESADLLEFLERYVAVNPSVRPT